MFNKLRWGPGQLALQAALGLSRSKYVHTPRRLCIRSTWKSPLEVWPPQGQAALYMPCSSLWSCQPSRIPLPPAFPLSASYLSFNISHSRLLSIRVRLGFLHPVRSRRASQDICTHL